MDTPPTQPEPESLAVLHEQDARHLRALLIDMAEQGAVLAKLYVQQAQDQAYGAAPGQGPSPECAAAYNSVSRSVRRSVLLIQKLTEPAPAPKADRAAAEKVAARKQVIRQVEDAIYRDAPEEEAAELHAEFLERLEQPEFDDELGQRPETDIVNDIRADLGILGVDSEGHWMRRTPEDIAILSARAASPGQVGRSAPFGPVRAARRPRAGALDLDEWADALLEDGPPIRGP